MKIVIAVTPLPVPVSCINYFTSLCHQIPDKWRFKGGDIYLLAHGMRDTDHHCREDMASYLTPIYGYRTQDTLLFLTQLLGS